MAKHIWSLDEEQYCCDVFIEVYIKHSLSITDDGILYNINNKFPNIPQGSINMKMQNIKQICEELKINNNCPYKPLEHYSKRNIDTFKKCLHSHNINF